MSELQARKAAHQAMIESLKQSVPDVPFSFDLSDKMHVERRRYEVRLHDPLNKFEQLYYSLTGFDKEVDGLAVEHYAFEGRRYVRIFIRPASTMKARAMLKMLAHRVNMELFASKSAVVERKYEIELEFNRSSDTGAKRRRLDGLNRIQVAHVFSTEERESKFQAQLQGTAHRLGSFVPVHDTRKALTTHANGKDLTTAELKDKIQRLHKELSDTAEAAKHQQEKHMRRVSELSQRVKQFLTASDVSSEAFVYELEYVTAVCDDLDEYDNVQSPRTKAARVEAGIESDDDDDWRYRYCDEDNVAL